jgi:hypothetical protein
MQRRPECVKYADAQRGPPDGAAAGDGRGARWRGEKARELLAAYEAVKPQREPLTFDDVERIWEEVVRPKLPEFETMKPVWGGQQAPAETSRWRANWSMPERGQSRAGSQGIIWHR